MSEGGIAVITGGASGIGHASALRLAKIIGHIVIADINGENAEAVVDEIKEAGGSARYIYLDVGDEKSVDAMAAEVQKDLGAPTALVNSAGILQKAKTTQAMSMEEHDRLWEINYRGTYTCCRTIGGAMAKGQGGVIVNLGSINSFRPLPLPAYNPGKIAIKGLTEMLAAELGPHNIRVNAVAPTYVITPAMEVLIETGQRDPEKMKASHALPMLVYPDHIAAAIEFLCSDNSAAITGVTLPVDAGWLAATAYRSFIGPVEM